MGKKRIRKNLTSKGQHSSTNRALTTKIHAEVKAIYGHSNLVDSWKKLQNPWLTIENPSKDQTNRKFIKVRSNEYWGNPIPPKEKERSQAQ
jgi:hypothetical protein